MILNSRNNLFDFRFPSNFIPSEVADKYKDYLERFEPIMTRLQKEVEQEWEVRMAKIPAGYLHPWRDIRWPVIMNKYIKDLTRL